MNIHIYNSNVGFSKIYKRQFLLDNPVCSMSMVSLRYTVMQFEGQIARKKKLMNFINT